LLFVFALGSVVAGLAAGLIMSFAGPNGLFYYVCATGALLGAISLVGEGLERRLQSVFVSVPPISAASAALDPRQHKSLEAEKLSEDGDIS
jgi:hypothetical protein